MGLCGQQAESQQKGWSWFRKILGAANSSARPSPWGRWREGVFGWREVERSYVSFLDFSKPSPATSSQAERKHRNLI